MSSRVAITEESKRWMMSARGTGVSSPDVDGKKKTSVSKEASVACTRGRKERKESYAPLRVVKHKVVSTR